MRVKVYVTASFKTEINDRFEALKNTNTSHWEALAEDAKNEIYNNAPILVLWDELSCVEDATTGEPMLEN